MEERGRGLWSGGSGCGRSGRSGRRGVLDDDKALLQGADMAGEEREEAGDEVEVDQVVPGLVVRVVGTGLEGLWG